jgi:hypothetical protein
VRHNLNSRAIYKWMFKKRKGVSELLAPSSAHFTSKFLPFPKFDYNTETYIKKGNGSFGNAVFLGARIREEQICSPYSPSSFSGSLLVKRQN